MKMQLGPRRPLVFVISAPSGGGKTTLVQEVIQAFPDDVERVATSCTNNSLGNETEISTHFLLTD